jgi:hypothetical protein
VEGSSTSVDYDGSGIGTGAAHGANLSIGNLMIENANVNGSSRTDGDYGGSGIGAGTAVSFEWTRDVLEAKSEIVRLAIENAGMIADEEVTWEKQYHDQYVTSMNPINDDIGDELADALFEDD